MELSPKPDVILTGKVLTFSINARSKLLKTEMCARTKIAVQMFNTLDGSTVRMTLNGAGQQTVFWFNVKDATELLNDVVIEAMGSLVSSIRIDNRLVRLKPSNDSGLPHPHIPLDGVNH